APAMRSAQPHRRRGSRSQPVRPRRHAMNAQPGHGSFAPPGYGSPLPPAPPPSPIPPPLRYVLLGCGGMLLLAAVVGTIIALVVQKATAGPEQTVQAFLAAAAAGDFAGAHGHFSAQLQQVQPLDQFSALAAANQQLFA